MGFRRKSKPRCPGCGLWTELCACALFPRVSVSTPVFVVRHARERYKPSNTAKLLPTMFEGVQLLEYAPAEAMFDPTPLQRQGVTFFNLFPRDDATALPATGGAAAGLPRPAGHRTGFVILDGTWHQCSRMSRRVPGVCDLPCVALPPGAPSIYRIRTQHDARGVSTFEAGIRLLELFEGPDVVAPAWKAFEVLTARMLFQKGLLPSPEVPASWNELTTESLAAVADPRPE